LSANSFLESAKYQIEKDFGAHGGFNPKNDLGRLALGLAYENITGVMPLYLFNEHWQIAKRKA